MRPAEPRNPVDGLAGGPRAPHLPPRPAAPVPNEGCFRPRVGFNRKSHFFLNWNLRASDWRGVFPSPPCWPAQPERGGARHPDVARTAVRSLATRDRLRDGRGATSATIDRTLVMGHVSRFNPETELPDATQLEIKSKRVFATAGRGPARCAGRAFGSATGWCGGALWLA